MACASQACAATDAASGRQVTPHLHERRPGSLCLRTQEQRKHLEVAEQLLLVVDCLCGTAIAADGMGKSTQWAAAWAGKAKVHWGRRR